MTDIDYQDFARIEKNDSYQLAVCFDPNQFNQYITSVNRKAYGKFNSLRAKSISEANAEDASYARENPLTKDITIQEWIVNLAAKS